MRAPSRGHRHGCALAAALAAAAAVPIPSGAEEPERKPPAVDQARIDEAVGKGAEWLRGRLAFGLPEIDQCKDGHHSGQTLNEIVLYALVHAGVDRGDPALIGLVHAIRQEGPRHTYTGAMRAMAFELYDAVKLKQDLVQCAQFLIDNQGKNGQWGYSHRVALAPIPAITLTPSKAPPRYTFTGAGGGAAAPGSDVEAAAEPIAPAAPPRRDGAGGTIPTGANWGKRPMTTPKEKKLVVPRRDFGTPNDNSNSQYALLGLSACMAGGVFPAPDCLRLAEEWWTSCQNEDGGWDYAGKGGSKEGASYGSMTAGGVSSLAVCLQADGKGRNPIQDDRIKKGLEWLGQNLTFGSNPLAPGPIAKNAWSHYYWIYAVERAGSLAGTEWFGARPWYSEGASFLLSAQNPDGSWGNGTTDSQKILDTCWSILFLRRATKQIRKKLVVYTHDSQREK